MYIYQVTIEGFKSYKDRTVIGPFDPKHNVVVGRNGSGKSNFFFAIQFVLSNEFAQLRAEQRQALLYEGSEARVISAYVEIILENSDRRLGIDKDKVFLKRTIGLKSDHYFLNQKIITRADIINLLESAGFSSSNPYYIVRQGKINEMALSSEFRLKILTEITGTKVYEDKKQESLLRFTNAQIICNKIEQHIKTIDERLATLKEETQELQKYQKWDKQQRTIEFIIHEHILMENKEELQKLENFRTEYSRIQSILVDEIESVRKKIKEENQELKQAKRMVQTAKNQENLLRAENEELIKEEIRLKSLLKDLIDESERNNGKYTQISQELNSLKAQIYKKEEKLQSIKSQFERIIRKEEEISKELYLEELKQKEFYKKQGRGVQFKNKNDRNVWIKSELQKLKKQIEDKIEHKNNIETDLKKDEEEYTALEKKIQESNMEINRLKNSIDDFNLECYNLNKQKNEYLTILKNLYKPEKLHQDLLVHQKDNLEKLDRDLKFLFGKQIINGKRSIDEVLNRFSENPMMATEIKRYCGLVIEIFSCDPKFYKAVEVTAGNRLLYHVVDTNQFAYEILKKMNDLRLPGEVTFMPLDCLKAQSFNYPESTNAKPLISLLKYENKFDKVLRKIFGNTLLCRDLSTAEMFSRKYNLNCITLEGDQAFSRGTLKGGHFYNSKSPMHIQTERLELFNQVQWAQQDLDDARTEISYMDRKITLCISEIQRLETKKSKVSDAYDKIKSEVFIMKEELIKMNKKRIFKEKILQDHNSSIEAMYATKESLNNDLVSNVTTQLLVTDPNHIQNLNDSITRLKKELKEIFHERGELEIQKNTLENSLTNNLIRKKEQLSQELHELLNESKEQQQEMLRTQLSKVQEYIVDCKDESEIQKADIRNANEKKNLVSLKIEEWREIENDKLKKLDEGSKKLETLINKEINIKQNVMHSSQCIINLGAIPSNETYSKFRKMSTKQLHKLLEEAKSHLKKYTYINQEALSKYNAFKNQLKLLINNKNEIDRAPETIQALIDILQQEKLTAIQFTFKQVTKYFSEIFIKLVPKGRAYLVIKSSNGQDDTENASETSIISNNFVGIDIMVSFTENLEETREIHQLSGGQKSLVTLALIFAIQKCDPAPFYLFDEIDQALDTEYRGAVAEMIRDLCSEAQFITTTFRPESLQHANKFFGVFSQNNISFVKCINREEAIDFLEEEMNV